MQNLKHLSPPDNFPGSASLFHSWLFYLLFCQSSERMRNKGQCSIHNSSSLLFLLPFPCSSQSLYGLPRNLCSGTGSISSPSFFPKPGAELLLTPVFPYSTLMCSSIFCFLNCITTEVPPALLMGSDVAVVVLLWSLQEQELAGIGMPLVSLS